MYFKFTSNVLRVYPNVNVIPREHEGTEIDTEGVDCNMS